MNIRDGILDALVDGGESLTQIQEYLTYLGIKMDKRRLFTEVSTLFSDGKLYIEYPLEAKNITKLNECDSEDYWFELTNEGRSEWENVSY